MCKSHHFCYAVGRQRSVSMARQRTNTNVYVVQCCNETCCIGSWAELEDHIKKSCRDAFCPPLSYTFFTVTILFLTAKRAEIKCNVLKGPKFAACRNFVQYDKYYENCKEDVCACEARSECLCDAVAAYAHVCLEAGVKVNWRSSDFCRKCNTLII